MMHPLWIAFPVLVWSLHFTVIYGFTSLACARGMANMVPWVVTVASVAAGAAMVMSLRHGMRRRDCFSGWMTAGLAAVALVAIVYESTGPYLLPICR
jgi:hypothetical protein